MGCVLIKEIGRVITGNTPSMRNEEFYASDDIGFIKPDIINDDMITYIKASKEFISEQARLKARMAGNRSVLVTCIGSIGKIGIIDGGEYAFNQQINAIEPNEKVSSEYLAYCLLYNKNRLVHIANAPVVPIINKTQFENFKINIIDEREKQNEIVEILNTVSGVITMHKEQMTKYDELMKSRFVEMFGDPINNSFHLSKAKLSELGELGRGISRYRPRNAPELLGGSYPLIQTGEVAAANLYITSYENTYSELGFRQSKMWEKGTLCITIAANIAKTAILGFDACFPDSVVGFQANEKVNNIFMHFWFLFFQTIIEEQAPESAQKNINLKILSELKVIVPPIELQNQFAEFVHQVDKLRTATQKSIDELQILFDSLLQKYFSSGVMEGPHD